MSAIGCGTGAEQVAASQSALDSDILGFESLSGWSSPSGTLSLSDTHVEGLHSVGVLNNGWTELISGPLSSLGAVGSNVSCEIRLPQTVTWGEIRLVLVMPSQQMWWSELGSVPLTGMSAGTFQSVQFPLSSQLITALSGTYSDLVVHVVINAPSFAGQPYLLDQLSFGQTPPAGTGGSGSGGATSGSGGTGTGGAATGTVETFSISYPEGLTVRQTFMSATDRLQADDRVTLGTLGTITNVASVGSAGFELGSDGNVWANAYSSGSMFLRSNSTVRGFARSAFSILTQEPVSVLGGKQPNTAVPAATTTWQILFPSDVAAGIFQAPDQPPASPLDIEPGAYAFLDLQPRARARLTTGRYFFGSFNTEPDAQVFVDTSAGPIYIYAKTQFRYHGQFVQQAGPDAQVLVGYLGTANADLQVGFAGTMVAPNAQVDIERPTIGQHKGAFFGKRIEVFSDATVEHLPFEGTLDGGGLSQAFPETPADGPTNMTNNLSGTGRSAKVYEACPAALDLVTSSTALDHQTALEYAFDPNSSCGYAECNDDNTGRNSPPEDVLNQIPDDTDVCEGTMPRLTCGVDPATVDMTDSGLCVDDFSCVTTGRVCALICEDAACTTSERRCAKLKATCAGLPQESACKDVRQCADVDYTGNPEPQDGAALGLRPSNDLQKKQAAPGEITNPEKSNLPATYPKGEICDSSVGAAADLPEQLEPREAHSGNEKWGIYVHPEVSFKGRMSPLAIGGDATLDFGANASFVAGVYVWGTEYEALKALASAELKDCEFGYQRDLEIFGVPVDIGSPGATHAPSQCASFKAARDELVQAVKFTLYQAEGVKNYVQNAGFTHELCMFTYGDDRSPFFFPTDEGCGFITPCADVAGAEAFCATTGGAQAAAHEWTGAYSSAVSEFGSNQTALDSARDALAALIPPKLEIVNEHHQFSFGPPSIPIPVGPAQVTIEVAISGGWGVQGDLILQLNQKPTSIGAIGQVTPDFDMTALAFAGIGFGPVSFGIGGELLMIDAEAPVQTGVHFTQIASDDNRPKDYDAPTAFPAKKYRWNADWTLGSRVKLSTLDGKIDLQARVRLLFFKKTFKKKIADWSGFSKTYDFLGTEVPLASSPDLNFGDFGEETAYVDPDWLDTNLTGPSTPISTPIPEVLGVFCSAPGPH